jgi:hypothetical protein
MNARNYLIAAIIAVLITATELAGVNALAGSDAHSTHRAIAAPDAAIPVLPIIKVRPTREEIRAAFAGRDLASVTPPDYAIADKG